jgi:capsular polysaccharide biosynthesis protein
MYKIVLNIFYSFSYVLDLICNQRKILFPNKKVILSRPKNLNQKDESLFITQFHARKISVAEVNDAILTTTGIALKNYLVIEESLMYSHKSTHFGYTRKQYGINYVFDVYKRRKINVYQDCVLVFNTWSHGYAHWITDVIPRLFILSRYESEMLNYTFLLPEHYTKPYHIELFKLLGIRKVFYLEKGRVYKIKKLLIPSHEADVGHYYPYIVNEATNFIKGHLDLTHTGLKQGNGRKIYVTRRLAKNRKVVNEEEVVDLLSSNGFEIVQLEGKSFLDQVKMFNSCSHLISIHGAALANIYFMNPCTRVMEFRLQGDKHNNFYFSLCSAKEIDYFYQLCDAVNYERDIHNADLLIDLNMLSVNLKYFVHE